MNNKGFMMAEVVVVSAIIMVFMVGMYTSYNKLFTVYNERVDYYDVTTLYRLAYYRDMINSGTDTVSSLIESGTVKKLDKINGTDIDVGSTLLLVHNNKNNLIPNHFDSLGINQTFKDYIEYLSTSVDLAKYEYVMIGERCIDTDEDDCKYAYLEVLDEA